MVGNKGCLEKRLVGLTNKCHLVCSGRHGQEAQALCGGRPGWKQGGPDQQAHQQDELNTILFLESIL
jgi:hypothetical protein